MFWICYYYLKIDIELYGRFLYSIGGIVCLFQDLAEFVAVGRKNDKKE